MNEPKGGWLVNIYYSLEFLYISILAMTTEKILLIKDSL